MAHLHLIIGPVGAGKSTFARTLAREHRAVRLTLDAWMATLFGADERPQTNVIDWYIERGDRCHDQIWQLTQDMYDAGTSVVLEIGLIQRSERDAFYARVSDAGYGLTVYVLDGPRDVRRARVEQRNTERGETFSTYVPPAFFELASDMWQAPEDDELLGRDVRFVSR